MDQKAFDNSIDQIKNAFESDAIELDPVEKDVSCNGTTVKQAISFPDSDSTQHSTDALKALVEIVIPFSCDVTTKTSCLNENNNAQTHKSMALHHPPMDTEVPNKSLALFKELKETKSVDSSAGDVDASCQPYADTIESQHMYGSALQDSIKPTSTTNTDRAFNDSCYVNEGSDPASSPSSPANSPSTPRPANPPSSPANPPSSPTNSPSSPANPPSSPTNSPSSPTNLPSSPTNSPSSPTNLPSSPTNSPSSPANPPSSPTNSPSSPTNLPSSPTNSPSSPDPPSSPTNSSSSPTNLPSSPTNSPSSPANPPSSPTNLPSSPANSPSSSANPPSSTPRSSDLVAIYIPYDDSSMTTIAEEQGNSHSVYNPLLTDTAAVHNAQNVDDVKEVETSDKQLQTHDHVPTIQESQMTSCSKETVEVHSLCDDTIETFDTNAMPTKGPSPVISNLDDISPLTQKISRQKSYSVSIDIPHDGSGGVPTLAEITDTHNQCINPSCDEAVKLQRNPAYVTVDTIEIFDTDAMPTKRPSLTQKISRQKSYSVSIDIPHDGSGGVPTLAEITDTHDQYFNPSCDDAVKLQRNPAYVTVDDTIEILDTDAMPTKRPSLTQKISRQKSYSVTIDIPHDGSGGVPTLAEITDTHNQYINPSCDETVKLQRNPAYVTVSDECRTTGTIDEAVKLQRNPAYIPISCTSSEIHLYEEIPYTTAPITSGSSSTNDPAIKMEKIPAYHLLHSHKPYRISDTETLNKATLI